MLAPIRYDPAWHQVVETPAARHLRRVIGLPNLLTYYHRGSKRWVVALDHQSRTHGRHLAEIAFLGNGGGEGPWLSTAQKQKIVMALRCLISAVAAKRKLKGQQGAIWQHADRIEMDQQEGFQQVHRWLKRTRGIKAAAAWADATNIRVQEQI